MEYIYLELWSTDQAKVINDLEYKLRSIEHY